MVFARMPSPGMAPFEFSKMHLYQYTEKIEHCSNKFDFLPLFCLEGLVPNSVLSGSRGCTESYLLWRFWREGWIPNKTLQKLGGTNPVIGISSDVTFVKL